MDRFVQYVLDVWLSPLPTKLVYAAMAAAAFEVIYLLTNRVIRRALGPALRRDSGRDPTERIRRRRIIEGLPLAANRIVWYSIALLMILRLLGLPTHAEIIPALAALIVIVLVVGRGLLRDVLRGYLISLDDLYAPGERVTIGELTGTVTELSLRTTRLRTADGREVVLPNGRVEAVANLSRAEAAQRQQQGPSA
ncbi:MAG: mechanosensitive ion channel domain-containing protein [Armatimonadota bacterium]